jgi:hypothetical protein
LTLEHRTPFALGGPPTLENLCLLCSAHNLEGARRVFGATHIDAKICERVQPDCAGTTEMPSVGKPALGASAQVVSTLCSQRATSECCYLIKWSRLTAHMMAAVSSFLTSGS